MGVLLAAVGLLVVAIGGLSVIYPLKVLRVSTRARGAMVFLLGIVLMGVGGAMLPPVPRSEQASSARPAGSETVAPPVAAQPRQWTRVASWTGNGIKDTETFTTTSREWRINWRTRNEPFPNGGILQIFVYNENGDMVNLAANAQGVRSDVSYIRTPPGRHYLKFNSANVDYVVEVEEQR